MPAPNVTQCLHPLPRLRTMSWLGPSELSESSPCRPRVALDGQQRGGAAMDIYGTVLHFSRISVEHATCVLLLREWGRPGASWSVTRGSLGFEKDPYKRDTSHPSTVTGHANTQDQLVQLTRHLSETSCAHDVFLCEFGVRWCCYPVFGCQCASE